MNSTMLIGRICNDIDLKYTQNQTAYCQLTLAVDRIKKQGQEKPDADFIPVQVWGKQAENCQRFLRKGLKVAVQGRIQVDRNQDDYGNNRVYTKVVASNVEFIEFAEKSGERATEERREPPHDDIPDSFAMINEEVPF